MALRSAVFDDDAGQAVEFDGEQLHHRRLTGHQDDAFPAGAGRRP